MKQRSLLVALVVVVGMVIAPAAAVAGTQTDESEDQTAPGERLGGVVGVQESELDGDIDDRSYEVALERAEGNASAQADVVADRVDTAEERLEELRERRADLEERREEGSVTEGQYRAEMAKIATELDNVERQLERSNEVAEGLPAGLLEERGINATAIDTLRNEADERGGQEIREIARSIAGENRGPIDRPDRVDDRGTDERDAADTSGTAASEGTPGDTSEQNSSEDRQIDGDSDRQSGSDASDGDSATTDDDPDDRQSDSTTTNGTSDT